MPSTFFRFVRSGFFWGGAREGTDKRRNKRRDGETHPHKDEKVCELTTLHKERDVYIKIRKWCTFIVSNLSNIEYCDLRWRMDEYMEGGHMTRNVFFAAVHGVAFLHVMKAKKSHASM